MVGQHSGVCGLDGAPGPRDNRDVAFARSTHREDPATIGGVQPRRGRRISWASSAFLLSLAGLICSVGWWWWSSWLGVLFVPALLFDAWGIALGEFARTRGVQPRLAVAALVLGIVGLPVFFVSIYFALRGLGNIGP